MADFGGDEKDPDVGFLYKTMCMCWIFANNDCLDSYHVFKFACMYLVQ